MKNIIKKVFTREQLPSAIVGAFAALIVMTLEIKSTALMSVKTDISNTITLVQSKFVEQQDFTKVIPNDITNAEADETGLYVSCDLKIPLNNGNILDLKSIKNCNYSDKTGFEIKIYNKYFNGEFTEFNSCVDNEIKTIKKEKLNNEEDLFFIFMLTMFIR